MEAQKRYCNGGETAGWQCGLPATRVVNDRGLCWYVCDAHVVEHESVPMEEWWETLGLIILADDTRQRLTGSDL